MANASQIFKDDEDEKVGAPGDDELRHITGIGRDEEGAMDREAHNGAGHDIAKQEEAGGFYSGDEGSKSEESAAKSASPNELSEAEDSPETAAADTLGKGFTGSGKKKAGAKGFFKRHRLAIILGGGGGGIVLIGILFLILFASSLALPNVMQHIENYEFATATNQFRKSALRVTDEKLALDAAPEGTAAEGATAGDPKGVIGSTLDRFKSLKDGALERMNKLSMGSLLETWGATKHLPGPATEAFASQHGLTLTYKTSSVTGRKVLTNITTDYGSYDIAQAEGLAKWTPGVKQFIQAKNQNAAFSAFDNDTAAAIKADEGDYGPLIKTAISYKLRKAIGGSLAGWAINKFQSDTPDQAIQDEVVETYEAGESGPHSPDEAVSESVKKAESAAEETTAEELQNPKELTTIINQNFDSKAAAAIVSALKTTKFQKALGSINLVYAFLTPVCIAEDSSVKHSQSPIDNQIAQQQDIFYNLAAKADQQKNGSTADDLQGNGLSKAIQATGQQLGDVSQSNPEIRAGGGTVNTGDTVSPEAGAGGSYTYDALSSLGVPSQISSIVDKLCPVLTDEGVAATLAALNIAAAVATAGSVTAIEEGAGEGAQEAASLTVNQFFKNLTKNLLGKKIVTTTKDGVTTKVEQGLLNRAGKFVFSQGLVIGGTVSASLVASMITASRSGQLSNGLAQGDDLVNEAESGGNIAANETERTELFGRPLVVSEVCQAQDSVNGFLVAQESQKSVYDRYLSFADADSLLSRSAMALRSGFTRTLPTSFINFSLGLFKPANIFGSIFNMLSAKASAAANCTHDSSDYGNLQFGWSDAENKLVDSNTSYSPLENQEILDASGNEAAIAKQYAVCFGYNFTGDSSTTNFDPTDPSSAMQLDITDPTGDESHGSLGDLLAKDYIARDDNGNVIADSGRCSPNNLTSNSSDTSLGADNDSNSPQRNDMIFRWRLAMSYDVTSSQLVSEAAVGTGGAQAQ